MRRRIIIFGGVYSVHFFPSVNMVSVIFFLPNFRIYFILSYHIWHRLYFFSEATKSRVTPCTFGAVHKPLPDPQVGICAYNFLASFLLIGTEALGMHTEDMYLAKEITAKYSKMLWCKSIDVPSHGPLHSFNSSPCLNIRQIGKS